MRSGECLWCRVDVEVLLVLVLLVAVAVRGVAVDLRRCGCGTAACGERNVLHMTFFSSGGTTAGNLNNIKSKFTPFPTMEAFATNEEMNY